MDRKKDLIISGGENLYPVEIEDVIRRHQSVRDVAAFDGGPIAVLRNGDTITIDIPNRTLKVELSAEELKARLAAWKPRETKIKKGILSRYKPMPTE